MLTRKTVFGGGIFFVTLNPARGSGIRKIRPFAVVSPDELNSRPRLLIVAPLATGGHPYPFRLRCGIDGKDRHVVADQLRAADRDRLVKRSGSQSDIALNELLDDLQAMFAV